MAVDLEIVIRIAGPMPGRTNYGPPARTQDGYEVLAWRNERPVNIGPRGERATFTSSEHDAREVAVSIFAALSMGAEFPLFPTPVAS